MVPRQAKSNAKLLVLSSNDHSVFLLVSLRKGSTEVEPLYLYPHQANSAYLGLKLSFKSKIRLNTGFSAV